MGHGVSPAVWKMQQDGVRTRRGARQKASGAPSTAPRMPEPLQPRGGVVQFGIRWARP